MLSDVVVKQEVEALHISYLKMSPYTKKKATYIHVRLYIHLLDIQIHK